MSKLKKYNHKMTTVFHGMANGFPASIELTDETGRIRKFLQEEEGLYICYAFSKWLEELPKGSVGGATNMLRAFFRERGMLPND